MVLVKGVYGIEIPRNSSSGFDIIGIPVEFLRNSGCGIPGAEFRSVEFHFPTHWVPMWASLYTGMENQ
jgi:hypothetical protein